MTQKNVITSNNSTPCQQKQQYQKPQFKVLNAPDTAGKSLFYHVERMYGDGPS